MTSNGFTNGDTYRWVVGGLLTVIVAMIGFLWRTVEVNLESLQTEVSGFRMQVAEQHAAILLLTGQLSDVRAELARTSERIESIRTQTNERIAPQGWKNPK